MTCFRHEGKVCLLASLTLLLSSFALGQEVTGSILGRVTDTSGAALPGAMVQIQNVETAFTQSTQTDAEGRYLSRNLPPGAYSITVQHEGFQTSVRRGLTLTVASELTINFELPVGNVQEKVEVTAEAPSVETTNATISGLVNGAQIRDLPLNGRSIDSLALLNAGVLADRTAQAAAFNGEGLHLSINGARTDAVLYLMDGSVINNHANAALASATGTVLGVEGILEFRLLAHNFSAEYGRVSGGVMSMVTRSGTNDLHGSAYEFLRNDVFDARNFFNPGGLPPFRRNQFGGAVGGAIVKDRLFFFANYEGLRQAQGVTINIPVPDVNARNGLLPNASGQLQPTTINSVAILYLNLYPLPNGKSNGDGTAQYLTTFNEVGNEDYGLARLDFRISDKDNLYWRWVIDPSSETLPRPVPIFAQLNQETNDFSQVSETHIFSATALNEFRSAFNRTHPQVAQLYLTDIPASLSFVPGQPLGRISFSAQGGGTGQLPELGGNTSYPQNFPQNLFQESDTFSITRGAHALKFGVDFQRIQLNVLNIGSQKGQYTFGGLAALMAGTPSQFTAQLSGAGFPNNSEIGYRRNYFGWFVQDDYRVCSNLTVNIGLRQEFFTTPTEVHGLIGDLINVTDKSYTPGPPFKTSKLLFSPRVGLAWDPTGSGKTSVRLGGGIFFNQVDGRMWYMASQVNPLVATSVAVNNPTFPYGLSNGFTVGTQAVNSIQYNLQTPTVYQYNLEVQRQLTNTLTLRAGYVGSIGYHMLRLICANCKIPQVLTGSSASAIGVPDGTLFYPTNAVSVNPTFGSMERLLSDAHYNYNALDVSLQKRFSAGLIFQVNYTYGKSMSDADETGKSVTTSTQAATMNNYDLHSDYSLSSYNQTHTLVANAAYRLPWGDAIKGKAAKAILGGWAVNGIYTYGSGLPFTVNDGFQNSRDGDNAEVPDRPNLVTGFSANPISGATAGCPGVAAGQKLGTPNLWFDPCAFVLSPAGTYGNLGRNTVISPGFNNVDAALVKTTAITERLRLEFRAEAFDLFNHPAFALPNRTVFSSNGQRNGSAGQITTTARDNRELQFGLKLVF